LAAYGRRPRAYPDPGARGAISSFALRGEPAVAAGLDRLAADLGSGRWHRRNEDLLERTELDLGYRLVVATTG